MDNVSLNYNGPTFQYVLSFIGLKAADFHCVFFCFFFAQGANVVAVVSVIKSHQSPVFSRTDEPPLRHPADKTDTH